MFGGGYLGGSRTVRVCLVGWPGVRWLGVLAVRWIGGGRHRCNRCSAGGEAAAV